jgi:hypothetical protein
VGKSKSGKDTKLVALSDRSGLPLAVNTASANPHEVTLVEQTLESRSVEEKPERLRIGPTMWTRSTWSSDAKASG